MRMSFLIMTVVALVASSMTAASAFNYATLSRTVGAAITSDDGAAYIWIESEDADYACLMSYADGKWTVTFNAGSTCIDGTGVNPDSVFYFSDVIKITNKGAKDLTGLWLNMTDDVIQTKTATSSGSNMATTSGWATQTTVGALTVGSSVYVGFKVDTDTTNLDTSDSPLSKTLTIEARATN